MRRAALALAFVAAACGGAPQSCTACQPTVARMQSPQEFFDFVVGGSSQPERTRESLKTANFYGNDAIWVLLPPGGESPLGEKILAWRAKPGTLSISGRRLDGRAPTAMGSAPQGYGDLGFQASGINFPTPGCWEVTYQLDGANDLRFVLKVEAPTASPSR